MDPLFRLLSPRILIQVNPQTFTFEGRRATVQLQTFLYIKQEGERCTVVCVGEEPSDTSQALRMDLFEDSSKAAGDKADGLVAFLHYAIRRVLTRRIVTP